MTRSQSGFSLAELIVVVAIIGVLMAASAPFFLSYYQSARLRAAAEEVAAFVNQARQLAIRTNNSVCVRTSGSTIHYRLGTCGGTIWVGAGTDSFGNIRVAEGVTITSTADPIFTYLGSAAPAATFTVTNTQASTTMSVAVATSGRITIGP